MLLGITTKPVHWAVAEIFEAGSGGLARISGASREKGQTQFVVVSS